MPYNKMIINLFSIVLPDLFYCRSKIIYCIFIIMAIRSNLKYNFKNLKPHWRHKRIFRNWFSGLSGKKTSE